MSDVLVEVPVAVPAAEVSPLVASPTVADPQMSPPEAGWIPLPKQLCRAFLSGRPVCNRIPCKYFHGDDAVLADAKSKGHNAYRPLDGMTAHMDEEALAQSALASGASTSAMATPPMMLPGKVNSLAPKLDWSVDEEGRVTAPPAAEAAATPNPNTSRGTICATYYQGISCKHGVCCPFLHTPAEYRMMDRKICAYHRAGTCGKGSQCAYFHGSDEERARLIEQGARVYNAVTKEAVPAAALSYDVRDGAEWWTPQRVRELLQRRAEQRIMTANTQLLQQVTQQLAISQQQQRIAAAAAAGGVMPMQMGYAPQQHQQQQYLTSPTITSPLAPFAGGAIAPNQQMQTVHSQLPPSLGHPSMMARAPVGYSTSQQQQFQQLPQHYATPLINSGLGPQHQKQAGVPGGTPLHQQQQLLGGLHPSMDSGSPTLSQQLQAHVNQQQQQLAYLQQQQQQQGLVTSPHQQHNLLLASQQQQQHLQQQQPPAGLFMLGGQGAMHQQQHLGSTFDRVVVGVGVVMPSGWSCEGT